MDQRITEYNEAGLKMTRIHELQRIINLASINKLGYFDMPDAMQLNFNGMRNYLVIFECLNQLFMEMTKITDSKRDEIRQKRNVLRAFIRAFPPFQVVVKADGTTKELFNQSNWIILEKELDEFEETIKLAGDTHGYSGRDTKDPRLAVTN